MSCESVQQDLTLYCYGELDAQQEERIEDHLHGCHACRAGLERQRRLLAALDRGQAEAPPNLLAECRHDLMRAIYRDAAAPAKASGWRLFPPGFPGLQLWRWRQPLGAFALVALGFFSARFVQTSPRGVAPGASPEAMVGNIRSVQQDSAGRVQVAFDETRRRVVSGSAADEYIQRLLAAALRQESTPGVRVESVSALKNAPASSGIREVLLYTLQNDPNAAVRLKAVESLREFAADSQVRRALAQVLIKDDNPGVRIQAIDLLVTHKDGTMVGVLQELVQRENNEYIRMRMANALEDMNASVGTF